MALIGIRADGDAGAEAGMGHVYRSLAYASRLKDDVPDVSVRFYMRDFPEGLAKVRSEGYPVSVLPPRPERSDFENAFAEHSPDLLIIDVLGSSTDLISTARRSARAVITVDDLEPSAGEADIVVNGILWGTRLLPEIFGKAKVFQGVEYIQLREQFVEANRQARVTAKQVAHILISTGGADGRGFAPQLMAALEGLSFACKVSVLVGPASQNAAELRREASKMSGRVQFDVVENVANMADFLINADLTLITGGTVMFESAACGTPAVIACSYEHQVPQAEWFAKKGCALNLGFFPNRVDLPLVKQMIENLAADVPQRKRMSEIGKAIVDGEGLNRFVGIVVSALRTNQTELCR